MSETGAPTLVAALLAAAAERRSGTFVVEAGATPTRLAFLRGELLLCGEHALARDEAIRCLTLHDVPWTFEQSVDSSALANGAPTRLEPLLQAAAAALSSAKQSRTKPGETAPTPSRAIAAGALKRLHEDVKKREAQRTPAALTARQPASPMGGAWRSGIEPGGKRTVVVVDDDDSIRAMIARVLSPTFDVLEASTGLVALELLGRIPPPSLILLDVMLPEVDGVAVARKLKAQPALRDVPIVFVTAKNAPADILKGIDAGASHYLTKPFSIVALKQVVEKLAR
jgi:CheY-like chemotaxis protein